MSGYLPVVRAIDSIAVNGNCEVGRDLCAVVEEGYNQVPGGGVEDSHEVFAILH